MQPETTDPAPQSKASDTGTTHGARDHARAQAGTAVRHQRVVPVANATERPTDVEHDAMLWSETVEGGGYTSSVLPRGARLRLTDIDGDTCVQLLVFNARQPSERLNVADTVKVQWQAYLSAGQLLLSDMGRVLLSITEDTTDGHDTFNAMSNQRWNDDKYGSGSVHGASPNARDRFAVCLTKHGLDRRDIAPAVNLFKPIRVEPDGTFTWLGATTSDTVTTTTDTGTESPTAPAPSSFVEFRCEMDVLVALTVTPHVLDPRPDYTVGSLLVTAWQSDITAADDPIRNTTPEGRRAFENTDDWLLGAPTRVGWPA